MIGGKKGLISGTAAFGANGSLQSPRRLTRDSRARPFSSIISTLVESAFLAQRDASGLAAKSINTPPYNVSRLPPHSLCRRRQFPTS
jgi:hypothetical protein